MITRAHGVLFSSWSPYQSISSSEPSAQSLDNFIELPAVVGYDELAAHEDFVRIHGAFLAQIDELRRLSHFFFSNQYDEKISPFYEKIMSPPTSKEMSFTAFRDTRIHLNALIMALKRRIPDDWDGTCCQALNPDQQLIALILREVLDDIDKCLPGVMTRFIHCFSKLKLQEAGLAGELYGIRASMAATFISDFLRERVRVDELTILPQEEVHWGNTFHNKICEQLKLQPIEGDQYAPAETRIPEAIWQKFIKEASVAVNDFTVFSALLESWVGHLAEALDITDHRDWLTSDKINLEEVSEQVLADINERVIDPLNQLMQTQGLPLQEAEKLGVSHLFKDATHEEDEDEFYTLIEVKADLAAWLASLLTGSMGEHFSSINAEGSQRLASLSDIYFWIVDTRTDMASAAAGARISFDLNTHGKVNVSHLHRVDFSTWQASKSLALLAQSIRQTYCPRLLVEFLGNQQVQRQLGLLPSQVKQRIDNELKNKYLESSAVFKTEFLQLSIKHSIDMKAPLLSLSALAFCIEIAGLEAVLLTLKENNVDISGVLLQHSDRIFKELSVDAIKRMFSANACQSAFLAAYQQKDAAQMLKFLRTGHCDGLFIKAPDARARRCRTEKCLRIFAKAGYAEGIRYLNERFMANYSPNKLIKYLPLIKAIRTGHIDCALELLKIPQIDINSPYNGAETALLLAVDRGQTELVIELLNHPQVDVNKKNSWGRNSLMSAARLGHLGILKLLLAHPDIDVNVKVLGKTAVYQAADNGQWGCVAEMLNQAGLDLASDHMGTTLLTMATRYKHWDIAERILERDEISINSRDREGLTALHYAVRAQKVDIVRALVARSDINIKAKARDTHESALDLAKRLRNNEIASILTERLASLNPDRAAINSVPTSSLRSLRNHLQPPH